MQLTLDGLSVPGWNGDIKDEIREVNGVRLHRVEIESAKRSLVILLHGASDFWWSWRNQMAPLASAGYHIVAPDQRGYNLSEKPISFRAYDPDILAKDVIALAEASGYQRFHVVGHDLGGQLAWWIASRFPERVESLISINSVHPDTLYSYIVRHPHQWLRNWYLAFFQLPKLPEALLRRNNFALIQQGLKTASGEGTFTDEVCQTYRRAWSQPDSMTGLVNWYRAIKKRNRMADLKITVPNLLLWGNENYYSDPALAEASLARCDNPKVVFFEKGMHYLHMEATEAVNSAILKFLKDPAAFPDVQHIG